MDEIPFDFTRKRMSVVVEYEGDHVLICKGAVEDVFKVCSSYQVEDDVLPMIDMIRQDVLEDYEALSADGYRVLAIGYREFPRDKTVFSAADESDMILLGYIAFFDPPKESTAQSLKALKDAGVAVKILTGDNDLVTRKVCKDVGIDVEHLVTGPQLVGLTPEQLVETAEKATVLARLSPTQKEQVIQALQSKGHVVGFMGDGINDAPALKKADVGISVDTAVDVAKEAADIVLLEKSLLVLDDGIIEGRKVFGNIIKYIRMGASSNFGNMFSVVGGSFFLPFLPMLPIQVLTNNMLYDISQIGIPSDRVDPEFTTMPRKWNIGNIRRFMYFIGPMSSIFDYATFFLMLYFFGCIAFTSAVHQPRHEGVLRVTLPHGLVRGIHPHADPHRAHHPNTQDSLHPEPGQPGHALLHRAGHGHRRRAPVQPGGPLLRSRSPAGNLLGMDRGVPRAVQRAHPHREDLVLQEIRSRLNGRQE